MLPRKDEMKTELQIKNRALLCGVDEVGRGPLAGPVVAAAVILDPQCPIAGLADSKALSAKKRDALFECIVAQALAFHIASASVEEIDRLNILQATFLAMQRAVAGLSVCPTHVQVDGNHSPSFLWPSASEPLSCEAIVQGDALIPSISAASILAKVTRDRLMGTLHLDFPVYGFNQHVGYPTAAHRAALQKYGPCEHHRRSFKPVQLSLSLMR